MRLICEGLSNREVAAWVNLSDTMKSHVQAIFRQLQVHNRVQAALHAIREGWV